MRWTIAVKFRMDADLIASVFAYNLSRMGEEPPWTKGEALRQVREHLYRMGMDAPLEDISLEQWHLCRTAVARLYPELNYDPGPPEICECKHWQDHHSSYYGAKPCMNPDCDCEGYRQQGAQK